MPPIAITSASESASSCRTGRLLVITRSASPRSEIRRATKYVVDDASRNTVSPGASSANAASASRAFASGAAPSRWRNECSPESIAGSTAPPCVRRAKPRSARIARSRRAVIGDTPNRDCRSVIVTAPDSCSIAATSDRRASLNAGRSRR